MTDKELKKLSRLELLELLLTESRENERLKEELEEAKRENTIERSAMYLSDTSKQLEGALQKVSSMISALSCAEGKIVVTSAVQQDFSESLVNESISEIAVNTVEVNEQDRQPTEDSTDKYVDFNIYKNLIVFFINNPESLNVLPDDLRQTVLDRIEEIKRK